MGQCLFANNANSTLNGAITSGQTNLVLQTGQGARFPSPSGTDYFNVTLDDGTNIEICRCYSRSTDTLNVVRGVEGTTANAFASGAKCELRFTSEDVDWLGAVSAMGWAYQGPNATGSNYGGINTATSTLVGSFQNPTPGYHAGEFNRSMNATGLTCNNSANYNVHMRNTAFCLNGIRGFRWITRFGFLAVNIPNSMHFFTGLCNTNQALTSLALPPSSMSGAIVLGSVNSGLGSNLSIWRADSGGTATQTDLGSYFTIASGSWYEFSIFMPALQGACVARLKRLDVGSIADAVNTYTSGVPFSYDLAPYVSINSLVNSAAYLMWGGWWWKNC